MAPPAQGSGTPSLQQLLALDKDFTSFDDQLDQAGRIVGLPNFEDNISGVPRVGTAANPRAEWVLRWLLGKLGAQDTKGPWSRSSIKAWKLLDRSLRVLPMQNSSRLLNGNKFLTTVEKTLEENIVARESQDTQQDGQQTASTEDGSQKSRKRKRPSAAAEEANVTKGPTLQPTEFDGLLSAISGVLDVIVHSTSFALQAHEAMVTEYMKSVLRTDVPQAARLLKLWIKSQDVAAPILDAMLPVWELSLSNLKNTSEPSDQFSRECLVPAATLLSLLEQSASKSSELVQRSVFQLQALFAKHVFLPRRAAFSPAETTRSAPKKGNSSERGTDMLSWLLLPLQADIESRTATQHESLRRLETLLAIAIRCSNRSTPKKRLDEAPWLQDVFIILSGWIPTPATEEDDGSAQCGRDTLASMLKTLNEEKVTLDSELLGDILRNRSKLFKTNGPWDQHADGELFAQVIRSDPSIFVGTRSESEADKPSLTQTLFDAITDRYGSHNQDDDFLHLEPGQPMVDVLLVANAKKVNQTAEENDDYLRLEPGQPILWREALAKKTDQTAEDILYPLIKAFAQARDLSGFISHWHTQLKRLHKPLRSKLYFQAEWEDKGLFSQLRNTLETSLTPHQIFEMIQEYSKSLVALNERTTFVMHWVGNDPESYASLVILDALVSALVSDETIEAVGPALRELQDCLVDLSRRDRYQDDRFLARSWRLLARLHTVQRPSRPLDSSYAEACLTCIDGSEILAAIDKICYAREFSVYWKGVEAFSLIATFCNDLTAVPSSKERALELFSAATTLLFDTTTSARDVFRGTVGGKLGLPLSVHRDAPEAFTLDATLILLQFPALLKCLIPVDSMSSLLEVLWWHTFGERYGGYTPCSGIYHDLKLAKGESQIVSLWELGFDAAMDFVWSAPSAELKNALLGVISIGLAPRCRPSDTPLTLVEQLQSFSEEKYLRTPISVIPRRHRQTISDVMWEILSMGDRGMGPPKLAEHLAVMIKMMELPNATSILQTQPSAFWQIARVFQTITNPVLCITEMTEKDCLELFEAVVELTLEHVLEARTQPKGQKYLAGFWSTLRRYIKKTSTLANDRAGLRIIKASLNTLSRLDILEEQDRVPKVLDDYVKKLCSELHSYRLDKISNPEDVERALALLDAVADLPVKHISAEGLQTELDRCLKHQRKIVTASEAHGTPVGIALARAVANISVGQKPDLFVDVIKQFWKCDLSAGDRHALTATDNLAAAQLDVEQKTSLILTLSSGEEGAMPSAETLSFLNVLILSLEDSPTKDESPLKALTGLLPQLCAYVKTNDNIGAFHALLDCIDSILREKHSLISQHGLESVFDTLGVLASPASPALPSQHGPSIYTRLCTTAQLILTLHRTRLGGRYHILTTLLQALLSSLFTPDPHHNRTTILAHPPWLSPRTNPLTPSHASAFARLLTILCSPTVSAVKGHRYTARGRGDLVDETKRAREYAGQYVVGVLAAFCSCQLHGRVGPEVRKEVAVGLWACVEVVGQEGLRALNAGLGASERAVWRTVYAEWKRFGKWEGR